MLTVQGEMPFMKSDQMIPIPVKIVQRQWLLFQTSEKQLPFNYYKSTEMSI